ncbi:PAS domain-containing protein, partial [Phaeobacter sp. SYSU ZJ3003]|uniref:PAS domain-containing protein n=1 Tax=Phaeobacter sp. SYSU ZJ3003 TaxID=2109330 RepID=UPI00351C09A9
MLILILSSDLELKFVTHTDVAKDFCPPTDNIGMPIEASKSLIETDPNLSFDCRAALKGKPGQIRRIVGASKEEYLRRISLRRSDNGLQDELIISYQAGALTPRLELAKVRQRFANAIEAVSDPVAYFDSEDRIVLCNTAYANLHTKLGSGSVVLPGMKFEEILRQDLENGALEVSKEAQDAWLSERLKKRRDAVFETEIRTRDRRWFRVIDRLTVDGDRVHLLIDISKLKTAQRQLEEVEAGSKVGLWSLNLETGEGLVNRHWEEMFGFEQNTLNPVGFEGWRTLVHPDDLPTAMSGFDDCIAGIKDRFEVEYRMRHKEGHWVWVLSRGGIADRDAEGRVYQMAGVLIDISTRKELEGDLNLRAAAVQASADAIMVTDASGEIIDANSALLRLFRAQKQEEILGYPWYRLYARSAAAKLAAEAFPAIRIHQQWRGEVISTRLDGSQFEQAISMTEMPDGKIVHVSRRLCRILCLTCFVRPSGSGLRT